MWSKTAIRPALVATFSNQPTQLRLYRNFSAFKDPKAAANEAVQEAKHKARSAKDVISSKLQFLKSDLSAAVKEAIETEDNGPKVKPAQPQQTNRPQSGGVTHKVNNPSDPFSR